ncbi:acyl-CoA thioesterase [Neomicrococcus aestuarii]|uniref:4-hydroxybenzoyl-CoA thioesterase n=1 Tax=Neomicrococcus aestuarii TaxID=556325 RepID=A0A1L2ZMY9_9MICC|nr:hotdog domain-containing protein [Neomicrococcus aestuarii]APF40795.1 acyl-CoA thioesterase [Neomicrococcus aestuarii]MBB5512573.1 4-hydroxybenzoyl-CoA thioesterase [Neomicrococcus aestuarii]
MDDRVTLRFLASPTDVSEDGVTVQAGRILEWIDKAGYACAVGYSGGYCVTAYVGNVHFTRPIVNGDLIEVTAQLVYTGRSSMHVVITVDAANVRERIFRPAMDCILVFVAMDENRKSKAVRPYEPTHAEARSLAAGVAARVDARNEIRRAMDEQAYTDAGTTPQLTFRFLASPTDVNWGGNAHGGIVMRWIDEVGRTCAEQWAQADAVAVYTGGIHFLNPVHIGDIVEAEARMIHTGPHSMHIVVHVRAKDPRGGEDAQWRPTTRCMTVFVTRDESGHAANVPQLELVTDEDRRLNEHALDLVRRRAALPQMEFLTERKY